jgi:hypothetical protein
VNEIDNSTCVDCDSTENPDGSAGIEAIPCEVDDDCTEGNICHEGACVPGASIEPPDFDLKSCQDNPPYGLNAYGTPLWTNGCSCVSHYNGSC